MTSRLYIRKLWNLTKETNMSRVSHSAMKRFENCQASYIYYMMLARINNSDANMITSTGSRFHEWAEGNFSKEDLDNILAEDESDARELGDMKLLVESRGYYKYPSINEMLIDVQIKDIGTVWGFPDRVVFDTDRKKIIIVDYKTAVEPHPQKDITQLFTYCYAIFENEMIRAKILAEFQDQYPDQFDILEKMCMDCKIEDFELLLDYVRVNVPYTVEVTRPLYMKHALYLHNIMKRIKILEDEFATHKNIKKLNHTDGNCTFCFMKGICMAYHMVINCYYDSEFYETVKTGWDEIQSMPLNNGCITVATENFDEGTPLNYIERNFCEIHNISIDHMRKGEIVLNSMGMISEYMERNRILKNNTERVAALKRSLMMRHESGDEVVQQYFARQQNSKNTYPTDKVLVEVLPKLIKTSLKSVKFKEMIDVDKVTKNLVPVLVNMIGNNLNKSSVPEDLHKNMDKYKTRVPSKAFLRER
jgi:hypothetical protein